MMQDPVAELEGLGQVVGDEHHRLADLVVQPDDLVLHVPADQRVERGERLVEQQHVRVAGQRPGQPDALLHAAGELVGVGRARSRTGRPARSPRWPAACARPARCRGSPGRRRRCRRRGGAAAGRSAGRPWRSCCRRSSRSRSASAARMSSPSNMSCPAVGSISRVRQRTSVDLPEPDRPITTNISPGATSKLTSRTAAVQPVRSSSSRRLSAHSSGEPGTVSAFGPEHLPQVAHRDRGIGVRRSVSAAPAPRSRCVLPTPTSAHPASSVWGTSLSPRCIVWPVKCASRKRCDHGTRSLTSRDDPGRSGRAQPLHRREMDGGVRRDRRRAQPVRRERGRDGRPGRPRRRRGRGRRRPRRVRRPRRLAGHARSRSGPALLRRIADLLQRDKEHLARVETLDTGKTLVESRIDVDDVTAVFRYYADLAATQEGRTVDVGHAARALPDRARAGRGVRADHAVELPPAAAVVEARARARRRAAPA